MIRKASTCDLKVGIVCGPLAPKYGGPSSVVQQHASGISSHGNVTVFGLADPDDTDLIATLFPKAVTFPFTMPRRWFRGRGLADELQLIGRKFDIIHAHMVWDHCVYAAWKASQKFEKPFFLTPHGTFSEQWRWRTPHKLAYKKIFIDPIFQSDTYVHCLTDLEADKIKSIYPNANTFVVPNGVSDLYFQKRAGKNAFLEKWPKVQNKKVVTYLGRLWGQKGLDVLPEAFAKANLEDAILVLAGPDYRNYRNALERRIKALGIEDKVLFPGHVDEALKLDLLRASDLFVLVSQSEGLSMSLLEASAAGVPSIISNEIVFGEFLHNPGGIASARTSDALAMWLRAHFERGPSELDKIRSGTTEWARRRYHGEAVIEQLVRAYRFAITASNDVRLQDHDSETS